LRPILHLLPRVLRQLLGTRLQLRHPLDGLLHLVHQARLLGSHRLLLRLLLCLLTGLLRRLLALSARLASLLGECNRCRERDEREGGGSLANRCG
jgi:hypothetical protein